MIGSRTARRGAQATVLLAIAGGVIALAHGGGASAAPGQADVDAARAELGQLRSGEQAALDELTAVSSKLAAARAYEDELAARVATQRERLAAKQRELESVRANQETAQRQLSERLAYWYRSGGLDVVEIVLGASSIDEALGQIDALRRISAQDARIAKETREAAAAAEKAARELDRVRGELESARKDAQADAAWLQSVRDEKQSLIARLRQEQSLTAARVDRLQAAADAAAAAAAAPPPPADGGGGADDGDGGNPPPDDGGGDDGGNPPPDDGGGDDGGGPPVSGRTMQVQATAYSDVGLTATGHPTGPGVCATDTSVIPHYTEFYVPGYGWCTSYDTGGAIVGNIIDIWVPTDAQAITWGRRNVTITFR